MDVEVTSIRRAIAAALERVSYGSFETQKDFDIELEFILRFSVSYKDKGRRINWRYFELGKRLFDCLGEAQNWHCCYCGTYTLGSQSDLGRPSFEHVVPLSNGGADHPDNLAIACIKCNTTRGERRRPYSQIYQDDKWLRVL